MPKLCYPTYPRVPQQDFWGISGTQKMIPYPTLSGVNTGRVFGTLDSQMTSASYNSRAASAPSIRTTNFLDYPVLVIPVSNSL